MPTVDLYNTAHDVVGQVELDDAVFGAQVRPHLFHTVVRYQLAKRRSGCHATKGRAMVSGGGRKPYRQKGTGRARQGSTRAPHYRGGGVVHGPHFRSHAHSLPKQVRRLALVSALSARASEQKVVVIDQVKFEEWKTRSFAAMLNRFEMPEVLLVLSERDELVERVSRNIQGVTVLPVEGLNVYDVLKHKHLALTQAAVDGVVARLKR
jgi:large subunit ribosomal protein L4